MTWDEIARIFEQLELMLIGSLRRNLAAHEDWEKEEGFDWPAWQALKLANLEKFRQQNQELMQRYAPVIDKETRSMLQDQFREGHATLKNEVTDNSFFGVNRRRNEALIEDMLGTEEKVESAALRMMDDVYRQTVNKTQLAMSAGAVNLPKAIDMATKDFLDKGINCIVYKNGSRHNIADYVQMALRTTATRSYLQGEAQKRQELGIDTVLVSQYGACSDTCLPWQGRVYIDDVFVPFTGERRGDEGKSREGNWYPLLSVAVRAGLFHPNCRHTLSTWYEGVSTLPKPMDARQVRENAKLEAKQREMETEVRKWKRLAEGTQDPEKRKEYRQKVRESQKKLREFIASHSDVLRRDYWRESTHGVPDQSPAARTVNTYREVEFNPDADYTIHAKGYSDAVNAGLSKASYEVAFAGGQDRKEHLQLIDLETGAKVYEEAGDSGSVGGDLYREFITSHSNGRYAFVHNHPTDGFLSIGDLQTLFTQPNIEIMAAIRNDGVKYVIKKRKAMPNVAIPDVLYLDDMKELNNQSRSGKITAGERTFLRETILTRNMIRDYGEVIVLDRDE